MKSSIEFIKDYAGRKKGEEASFDPMLASSLVERKKAKYTTAQLEVFSELKVKAEKKSKATDDRLAKAEKAEKTRIAKLIALNKKKKTPKK